ncbi:single-stranded DNA-binding protein [Actinoplanes flavus]|uniref:Single-stranded DNA-binding protein n=1 Tax=Actinoplanes flavus TaxID=2820290 RepID=A0ABS3UFV3_9ACTN|nr:single-stranded DNA-binding protein [Actinoplanes flavus]MBO3736653.1 single-stranded DNA-binding protein [Actinoplanes flavus]
MFAQIVYEGKVSRRPETGVARDGREYTQFEITHFREWVDGNKKRTSGRIVIDIVCWGELAQQARKLSLRTTVTVVGITLMPYDNNGVPGLKMYARELSVNIRDIGNRSTAGQRSGHLVTSPEGETIAAEAWPDVVGDLEAVHRSR